MNSCSLFQVESEAISDGDSLPSEREGKTIETKGIRTGPDRPRVRRPPPYPKSCPSEANPSYPCAKERKREKQAKKIFLKERLSKVGDFDESKVDAIFDMLIANGQLTLPPCKRPAKIEKVDDSNYLLSVPQVVGHTLRQSFLLLSWCKKASGQRH